jgi:hypothetical protein
MNLQLPLSGVSPPLPSSETTGAKSSSSSMLGQQLLTLLRCLENNPSDVDSLEATIETLQKLIAITHRRGLLQGDETVAEKILSNRSNTSSAVTTGSTKKRRGGKRGRSNEDLVIHTNANPDDSSTVGPALDGQLIMSAMTRILVVSSKNKQKTSTSSGDGEDNDDSKDILLIALAADLLTAISTSILSRSSPDTCTVAEYELMATAGKQLLAGLEKSGRNILQLLQASPSGSGGSGLANTSEEHAYALLACLQASSSLVTLFGTKLSRSTALLAGLRRLGWECFAVTVPSDAGNVVELAAKLLATLPLAGGTDNATPSDLWNQCLDQALSCLSLVLHTVAPLGKTSASSHYEDSLRDNNIKVFLDEWVDKMKRTTSEIARGDSFLQLVHGLVALVTSLVARDDSYFGMGGAVTSLTMAQVDCDAILSLVDTMISFTLASEATFHGTKKRLRSEPVDGGLISASVLASKVANQIKLYGHKLLDSTLLSSAGTAALFPYARRILRISHAALLTSSSVAVRRVADPSSEMHFRGKRQRWLHNAVVTRIAAVQTIRKAILAFGCDPSSKNLQRASTMASCSRDVERSVHLMCGYIVEELTLQKTPNPDEWGSLYERADLVAASAECLAAILPSGGEYLSLKIRGLLDSTASLCLSCITSARTLSTFGHVRASFLLFSTSCVGTPWSDGAASSITNDLMTVARSCQQDPEAAVLQAANSAIQLCEAFTFPRVPALTVVTRSSSTLSTPPAEAMQKELADVSSEIDARRAEELRMEEENERKKREEPPSRQEKKKPKIDKRVSKPTPELKASEIIAPPVGDGGKSEEGKAEDDKNDKASPDVENKAPVHEKESLMETEGQPEDDDGSDEDFPMIVDCGPDDDDV